MSTDKATIEAYNKNASDYHQHVSSADESPFHAYYEKPAIRSLLPNIKDLRVLCLGCGSGIDAKWLSDQGAEVVGIDISQDLLDIGNERFPELDLRLMDMEGLDFEDGSFDVAYSSLALHHLDSLEKVLSEVSRVLRPGGLFIFSHGHPVAMAMEKGEGKYKLLGKKKLGDGYKVFGDYMAKDGGGTKAVRGSLNEFEVTVYHRTFGVFIDQINSSGFQIKKLHEPLPLVEMKDHSKKSSSFDILNKIPEFMIWVLEKPR